MQPNQIDDLRHNAWVHTQAELAGLKDDAEELLPYLVAHMTRSEAACARAVALGILPPPLIDALGMGTRSFVVAAANGRRAFCQKAPCEWRGGVAEAGPVGKCPLCSHAPVSILEIQVPPSGNGRHNLRAMP